MILPLLVSTSEAEAWGFEVSDTSLRRASARIRGHLSQLITEGTSTITATGPAFRLPQRPVVEVSEVVDADGVPVDHNLDGSILEVGSVGSVSVTYSHGYASGELPESLIEFVCQVAKRLDAPTSEALAAGVQSNSIGSASATYGWDSYKAQSGLTEGEKVALRRIWPTLPNPVRTGAASG